MNKYLKLAGLGLLSSALVFSTASYAQRDQDGQPDRPHCDKQHKGSKDARYGFGKMKHVLSNLDLTASQEKEIDAIMAESRPTMKSMHEAMKDSREKLRSLMTSNEYDADAVQQAANEQANLMVQQIVFMAQTKARVFELLTTEQRQELVKKMESRKRP
jgi:Spy/CpxP family protein refolding chaperone